ncbi:hypothetical protein CAOG_06086 [Capsaspora owczarzaki ATCC 30864]|uniref:Transmembrane protein n=1 Tax=Capsaspora owczarzaki (strain ATCC 30864) TaxID=595528 RepID=A0A0D2X493_CAPO3|nr:hypothetical protein CAOG_06086 [Capsaspora owczarzaki ATCC 30864]KJE95659.1 hypothetical protein CAOG_006086 [Capsaspora owczarzaki ATCC 30864]|eukprot:XP_004345676.1 hypothetical protein CAOG_06086 [Capsaspora owczarzaki ATCC 30864]
MDNSLWRSLYKTTFFSRKMQRQATQGKVLDISWKALFAKMYKRQRALPNFELKVENHRDLLCLPPSDNMILCSPVNIAGLSRWLLVERCSEGGLNENNHADFCVLQRQLRTGHLSLIHRDTQHTVIAFHRVCNAVFCTLSWWIILLPFVALIASNAINTLHANLHGMPRMFENRSLAASSAAGETSDALGQADASSFGGALDGWEGSLLIQAALLALGILCWYGHVSRQMLAENVTLSALGFSTVVCYFITRVLAQYSSLMLTNSIVFILMFCSSMANVTFKHRLVSVQYPTVETSLCLVLLVGMLSLAGSGSANLSSSVFESLLGINTNAEDHHCVSTGICVFSRNIYVSGWWQHIGNLILLLVLDRLALRMSRAHLVNFTIAVCFTFAIAQFLPPALLGRAASTASGLGSLLVLLTSPSAIVSLLCICAAFTSSFAGLCWLFDHLLSSSRRRSHFTQWQPSFSNIDTPTVNPAVAVASSATSTPTQGQSAAPVVQPPTGLGAALMSIFRLGQSISTFNFFSDYSGRLLSASAVLMGCSMAACIGVAFQTLEMDKPTFLVEFAVLFLFRYSCTNLYTVVNHRDQLTDIANFSYYGLMFGIGYVVCASIAAVVLPLVGLITSFA